MNVRDAESGFLEFLQRRGEHLSQLTPATGPDAMIAFYREVRARGCRFEDDQDSLLFQWGRHRRGDDTVFVHDLTRQFITGDGGDGDIWQLSLTFELPLEAAADTLQTLAAGDLWCASLDEVEAFAQFVRSHASTEALRSRGEPHARLIFDCAG